MTKNVTKFTLFLHLNAVNCDELQILVYVSKKKKRAPEKDAPERLD